MTAHEIYPVPVISTAHMAEHVAKAIHEDGDGNEWGVPVANYQYGCILFTNTACPGEFPESIKAIYKWANKHNYCMVRLDCDADPVPDLPVYDW